MRSIVFLSLVTIFSIPAANKIGLNNDGKDIQKTPASGIDQIVTGKEVSSQQLIKWRLEKERYDGCGGCPKPQAYPDDKPVLKSFSFLQDRNY